MSLKFRLDRCLTHHHDEPGRNPVSGDIPDQHPVEVAHIDEVVVVASDNLRGNMLAATSHPGSRAVGTRAVWMRVASSISPQSEDRASSSSAVLWMTCCSW